MSMVGLIDSLSLLSAVSSSKASLHAMFLLVKHQYFGFSV